MRLRKSTLQFNFFYPLKCVFFVLVLCVTAASNANAETLIQTASVSMIDSNFQSNTFALRPFLQVQVEESQSFNKKSQRNPTEFNRFDPELGTLESVEIIYMGQMTSGWIAPVVTCNTFLDIGSCSGVTLLNATAETGLSLSNWDPYRPVLSDQTSPVELRGAIRAVNGSLGATQTNRPNNVSETTVLFDTSDDLMAFTGVDTFQISAASHLLGAVTIKCTSESLSGTVFAGDIELCKGSSTFSTQAEYNVVLKYNYTPNTPPVAIAGQDQTVEATTQNGAEVTLDASASYDNESEALSLSYTWKGPFGSAEGQIVTVLLPVGMTTVTLDVSDGTNLSSDTVDVSVVDTTAPMVTAPANIVELATDYTTAVAIGSATATDIVDGIITPSADNTGPYPLGDTIVKWTATDAAGNSASATQIITINFIDTDSDGTPDFDDPDKDNDGIPNEQDPNELIINQTPIVENLSLQTNEDTALQFSLNYTDSDGPTPVSVTIKQEPLNGTLDGTGLALTYRPNDDFFGTDVFSYSVSDGYLESNIGEVTITVLSVNDAPELTLSENEVIVQYSDSPEPLLLSATDIDSNNINFDISGLPDGLSVGELTCTTTSDDALECQQSLTGSIVAEPGIYMVEVSASDGEDQVSQSIQIEVIPEDAVAVFTGPTLITSQEDGSFSVTLRATILDITAVPDSQLTDLEPGDITNTIVSFVDGSGNPLCTALLVTELLPDDVTAGSASCVYSEMLGNADSLLLNVSTVVDDYYANSIENEAVVTITRPGNFRLSGGGFLSLDSSAGVYRSAPDSAVNFGYSAKAVQKRNKFQFKGVVSIIIRAADGRKYKIKSTSVDSIGFNVDGSLPEYGQFQSKANLSDVTDEQNPISLGGNLTLLMSMTDNGEPGSSDTLAITLWDDSGSLLFSSYWDGSQTLEQNLTGGNLQVQ